jgi:hypothetical protein
VVAAVLLAALPLVTLRWATADDPVAVEGQPLAENAKRLLNALTFLGTPMPPDTTAKLNDAINAKDAIKIQQILDPQALVLININPEARVKAKRGPGKAVLQQSGFVPVLLKIVNDSTVTKSLRISSPQAGAIYSGGGAKSVPSDVSRFLDVEIFKQPPMTDKLSGLKVEYALALIYSNEAGKREVTLSFDIGEGTADLGFRPDVPILFDILPALKVKLDVKDFDGKPTVGRFTFRDKFNRVYPPRAKRLAPDFFFQDQVYRADGGTVLLPTGELTMEYGRGPEYQMLSKKVVIPVKEPHTIAVKLERWVNPMDYGYYNGDHHIHAAGCAHYTNPTEGVFPEDMFLHVKGEGLNVGCNLTWGPCFDFQRQFFTPDAHKLSEPFTVLKYDIEVSGFGSQSLGHVCLLNLKDQTYPGSDGLKTKGWPTWTTPLMKWAKQQGAYTGYAHSASGLQVNPVAAAERLLFDLDTNKDGKLSKDEAAKGLLPFDFAKGDTNQDGFLSKNEIVQGIAQCWNLGQNEDITTVKTKLPNLAIPELNGIGAQEVFVTSAQGLCDFISAMDTMRVPEWNCWYHIMNCGFPLKVSGETDFPCISGGRVGEGRVYVQMGKIEKIFFPDWAKGLGEGRSYVSDGYAHALQFTVGGKVTGDTLKLKQGGTVDVKAKVAFARDMPLGTAKGASMPKGGSATRLVELIVNGQVAASKVVPADDKEHDLSFNVKIDKSSWVALRHFPQMHTNPINVIVAGQPIRASKQSALWCAACIEQLWRARNKTISEQERPEAEKTFQKCIGIYKTIAAECSE